MLEVGEGEDGFEASPLLAEERPGYPGPSALLFGMNVQSLHVSAPPFHGMADESGWCRHGLEGAHVVPDDRKACEAELPRLALYGGPCGGRGRFWGEVVQPFILGDGGRVEHACNATEESLQDGACPGVVEPCFFVSTTIGAAPWVYLVLVFHDVVSFWVQADGSVAAADPVVFLAGREVR